MLLTGEKSTVPLSNTRSLLSSKLAVRAPFAAANVSFAEKFSPSSSATFRVINVGQHIPDVLPILHVSQIERDRDRAFGHIDRAGVQQLNWIYQAPIDRRRGWPEVRKINGRANRCRSRKQVATWTWPDRSRPGALRGVGIQCCAVVRNVRGAYVDPSFERPTWAAVA